MNKQIMIMLPLSLMLLGTHKIKCCFSKDMEDLNYQAEYTLAHVQNAQSSKNIIQKALACRKLNKHNREVLKYKRHRTDLTLQIRRDSNGNSAFFLAR